MPNNESELRTKFLVISQSYTKDVRDLEGDPCPRCGRTISAPVYWIRLIRGGHLILHPSEYAKFEKLRGTVEGLGDCGFHPVGVECRNVIGKEWTCGPEELVISDLNKQLDILGLIEKSFRKYFSGTQVYNTKEDSE